MPPPASNPEAVPKRQTCWVDETLVQMAKAISALEGGTVSEVVEQELRAPLTRRYRKAIAREHAELGEAGA